MEQTDKKKIQEIKKQHSKKVKDVEKGKIIRK